MHLCILVFSFFFNDTATTEIYTPLYTLSLHDALPIWRSQRRTAPPAPASPHSRSPRRATLGAATRAARARRTPRWRAPAGAARCPGGAPPPPATAPAIRPPPRGPTRPAWRGRSRATARSPRRGAAGTAGPGGRAVHAGSGVRRSPTQRRPFRPPRRDTASRRGCTSAPPRPAGPRLEPRRSRRPRAALRYRRALRRSAPAPPRARAGKRPRRVPPDTRPRANGGADRRRALRPAP